MSVRIMASIWGRKGLNASERLVLLALADCADDQGKCWPSMEHIGGKCDMTDRGVRGIIRRLETAGHILTNKSKGRGSNVYQIADNPELYSGLKAVPTPNPEPLNPEHGSALEAPNPERGSRNEVPGKPPTRNGGSGQPGTVVPGNHKEPSITKDSLLLSCADEKPRPKRKTRIPETAVPSEANYTAASKRGLPREEADDEFERFKNHHLAKGNLFADWSRAWITWLDSPFRQRGVRPANPRPLDGSGRYADFARNNF